MNELLFSIGFMSGSLFTCGILFLMKKIFFTNHITPPQTNKDLEDISLIIKNLHINHKKDKPQEEFKFPLTQQINKERKE